MLSLRSRLVAAAAFAGMAFPCALAQQGTPVPVTIQVTDSTGAAIPSAAVTVIPNAPSSEVDAQTDKVRTLIAGLKPGSYRVSVKSQGFSPLTKVVEVPNSKAQTLQLMLNVGSYSGPAVTVSDLSPRPSPEHAALTATLADEPVGSLRISAGPDHTKTLDLATLKAMPHKTVNFHNAHNNADETYSGVPLIDLLASLGVPHGKDLHGKGLSEYVVATGSDGYKAVLALAEVDPEFHPGDVIVADTMDGKPIDAKNGPLKLVVTEDKRPARSVHNLVSIEVRTAE